jgi:hypothetical protein
MNGRARRAGRRTIPPRGVTRTAEGWEHGQRGESANREGGEARCEDYQIPFLQRASQFFSFLF